MMILTGCPSPGGNNINPGNPDSPERTLSFTLELSEPNGNPLELGTGPSLTTVTSDAGTAAVGTVRGKTYPITVTQVPPNVVSLTLTVRKKGFLDTAIGPITIPPKGNPPPQTRTIPYAYTTTITGKVVTPARAADPAKGSIITTAQVWASTDPGNKVTVDTADGSCTLEGVRHSGTFTIIADYTATDGNYKAGDPQSVTTTAAAHTQNVALKYGYPITLSGRVFDNPPGASVISRNGATVIITVESRGLEVARTTSSTLEGNPGSYRVTFDHPGRFRITASFGGRSHSFGAVGITTPTTTYSPVLN